MTKTQPEEEHVLAAISEVIDQNPEFGVKRVASFLKEQNPEWSLGEKRVTKLLKKVRSDRTLSSTIDEDNQAEEAAPIVAVPIGEDHVKNPWNAVPEEPVVPVEEKIAAIDKVEETPEVEEEKPAAVIEEVAAPVVAEPVEIKEAAGFVEPVVETSVTVEENAVVPMVETIPAQGFVAETVAEEAEVPAQGFVANIAAEEPVIKAEETATMSLQMEPEVIQVEEAPVAVVEEVKVEAVPEVAVVEEVAAIEKQEEVPAVNVVEEPVVVETIATPEIKTEEIVAEVKPEEVVVAAPAAIEVAGQEEVKADTTNVEDEVKVVAEKLVTEVTDAAVENVAKAEAAAPQAEKATEDAVVDAVEGYQNASVVPKKSSSARTEMDRAAEADSSCGAKCAIM